MVGKGSTYDQLGRVGKGAGRVGDRGGWWGSIYDQSTGKGKGRVG